MSSVESFHHVISKEIHPRWLLTRTVPQVVRAIASLAAPWTYQSRCWATGKHSATSSTTRTRSSRHRLSRPRSGADPLRIARAAFPAAPPLCSLTTTFRICKVRTTQMSATCQGPSLRGGGARRHVPPTSGQGTRNIFCRSQCFVIEKCSLREVRDSSQSFSSDTLQGISPEWSGDTAELIYMQKKGELSLVEDVIWSSSKRWNSQPMESLKGLDLQGANELSFFAERRIQKFDESRFQVDCSIFSTKSKLHLQPMTTRLFLSPKLFLIGHCFNQWDLFFSVYKPVR